MLVAHTLLKSHALAHFVFGVNIVLGVAEN